MSKQSRKVIGVLGRPDTDSENYSLFALYDTFRRSIINKNCIPFMICPTLNIDFNTTEEIPELNNKDKEILKDMVDMCDGIVIPGGYRWFNYDEFVVNYALEKDIPILGTCMGMQLLATIDNQEKCLELIDTDIDHCQKGIDYAHNISIENNTILSKIVNKKTLSVNSKHKFCINHVNNFIVSAYSEDGIIEAIELPNKKCVIGVQWHPEKMLDFDEDANKIIDYFINCL